MHPVVIRDSSRRYQNVNAKKANGATYTPENLARFVAERIVENADFEGRTTLSILDPAIGDGSLVVAVLEVLRTKSTASITVRGFDTDDRALDEADRRIRLAFPQALIELTRCNFLDFVIENADADTSAPSLNLSHEQTSFDLIIANPPYVRTQIMGSARAQLLAKTFGLAGRIDLYQAFLLGVARVLGPHGTAGIIVSNRFMTTKGGAALRAALRQRFDLRQVWDLGDSKLFGAAVLPAVIVARGMACRSGDEPRFTSIYEVNDEPRTQATDPIEALDHEGVVQIEDGRRFSVRHGALARSADEGDVWRLSNTSGNEWLATVERHTWNLFGRIGKIRVGVKTCADKIFIRHDWDSILGADKPELLRPLTTHHTAGRFRSIPPKQVRAILYPHEIAQGNRQAIPLDRYPKSRAYLETHRSVLESRTYVLEAGRLWYELWVPQDPQAWSAPKLVFRDISERPTFWIDLDGSVVNGDCYWLAAMRSDETDLLWLATAVANSTFAEMFYDSRFNNKLYAGRRRFITQYVELFPLPDPALPLSKQIVADAKAIYALDHSPTAEDMEAALNERVWQSFGFDGVRQ